jgi:hypothetical protein
LLGTGARWKGGVALGRKLVGKVVRAEIAGDPVEVITSIDGVVSYVIKPGKSSVRTNTPRIRPTAAVGTGDAINVATSSQAET